MAKVIDIEEVDLDEPTLLEGFPGVGLVGTIATQYLYNSMELEQVAKMESEDFPPVAVVHEGVVRLPVRLYRNEEHSLLLVVSELPIHPKMANDVAETLVDWSRENGVREIVSLAGVGTMETEGRIFGATTSEGLLDKLPEDVEVFGDGNISGISGSVMVESSLAGMDGICLLGETQVFAPDPRSAASVINVLNEMYGIDVDTEELMEQADQIESQMRGLAEQTKRTHEEGETEAPTPVMYG
ncbi:MAG: hypothetical protein MAG715_01324 [Methanonatronarchaeales archaeon]|nr:hypothetical protein [Methanonatronarchaeales archaeon]